ncbi:hypothetical protein MAR_036250 [Mya arenaria]|uniref:Uncharacterized protein n=1 Tax=Mya arenaria TaxID=6604 RepID=A0ABY7EPX6_MYAAR|nr:hypothetical protein MAR_036250 [Mya arenaria]
MWWRGLTEGCGGEGEPRDVVERNKLSEFFINVTFRSLLVSLFEITHNHGEREEWRRAGNLWSSVYLLLFRGYRISPAWTRDRKDSYGRRMAKIVIGGCNENHNYRRGMAKIVIGGCNENHNYILWMAKIVIGGCNENHNYRRGMAKIVISGCNENHNYRRRMAKIVIGAIHLHDCPLQDKVPIWLIVSGVAPIFFGGSARKEEEDGEARSVWVYPTYGTVNKDDFVPCIGNVTTGCSQDCHKPTLTFAFAMVTVDWIFFALWLTIIMCSVRALCARYR